ncbi:MAG TPA: aminotransferase class I/II-fold pyridoxal phosphate-dependent enzyme [Solirubrobacteraceae bacterium]|nr:aminotransferase class I/II-fold pyridoxal phosphate-dependent enzyme [Solirubrobacteraceae bacterium]
MSGPGERARTDTLGLETDEMRRLGYWVVDRVVEHFEQGADGPAISASAAGDLRNALGGPVPEAPGDPIEAMQTLVDFALSNMQHGDHPRYFARVPGPSSYAGVLGDWLGTGFNVIAASWAGSSGPSTVELVSLDWLRQLLGLPDGTEGILMSGGSLSNMTALAAARSHLGSGVAYLSDQTHASITRALIALRFPADEVRVLVSDDRLRLTTAAVAEATRADRARGLTPRFIIATAGTTNTGAVDELEGLAELAAAEGMWFHVDGAYGAPAALCPAGRAGLHGLELADSLVLDPHKWLFAPYDIGCLFVRRPGVLDRTFSMRPEYLADVRPDTAEVNFGDRSLELTRRGRALKLWLVLKVYGATRVRDAIARCIGLAEHAQRLLESDPGWEVVTPAQLGIVTFARPQWSAEEHAAAAAAMAAGGYATVTSTVLGDRPALRLCTINPLTTESEIEETVKRLADAVS